MKSYSVSSKLIAAVLTIHCCVAFAQETNPRPLPHSAPPDPQVVIARDVHHGAQITLVSIAEPTRRQSCLVDTFKDETVTCSANKGAPASLYKETELVAILKHNEFERGISIKRFLTTFGFGAGAIAGAAFLVSLSTIAAIPVAVLGGIFLLDATIEALDDVGREHSERVVYLNPTQQLQIAPR